MIDNLERISCEHRKTLINLKNEKDLQCDHVKAAQVRRTRVHEAGC